MCDNMDDVSANYSFFFCKKNTSVSIADILFADDPNNNSFIQNPNAPDDDPNLTEEEYERTYEQNEELGLNDMKTENYSNE